MDKETFLNSGKYQYQIVINDKWGIDKTNSDSTSNELEVIIQF